MVPRAMVLLSLLRLMSPSDASSLIARFSGSHAMPVIQKRTLKRRFYRMHKLKSHDRFPYSGIPQRSHFNWPDGKRLALYIALSIEHFPFGEPGGIDLDRETKPWSQRSWLWREYGNRVGGWRLADLFDELEMNV